MFAAASRPPVVAFASTIAEIAAVYRFDATCGAVKIVVARGVPVLVNLWDRTVNAWLVARFVGHAGTLKSGGSIFRHAFFGRHGRAS